jgi:glycosyltransferase involved in cell wall biosynthesis
MNQRPAEIVHIAVNRWDSMIQREQRLIAGLSRFYRVLFVDPPLSFLTLSVERMKGKKETFRSRVHRVNDRLIIYTPPAFPPFSQNSSWIRRWNTHLLSSRIKILLQELSFKNYVLGISWPLWVGVLRELRPRWSYYDCSDDYLTYPGLRAGKKKLRQSEEELLRSVNLVFCSSQRLKEAKTVYNPNCFFIPNGVDPSPWLEGHPEEGIPPDMKPIRKPVLGYVGTLGEWVDFDALVRLARTKPEWSIVMVGPLTTRRFSSMLTGIPNLYWLGEKGYNELPGYLKNFDVCLIPFKVNEFTEKIYPTKFHQYLGAGKPVVSSSLPELEPFKPWVIFYRDGEGMEEAVGRALREDSEEKALMRKRIAGENTWDRRVKSIVEIFDRFYSEKGPVV